MLVQHGWAPYRVPVQQPPRCLRAPRAAFSDSASSQDAASHFGSRLVQRLLTDAQGGLSDAAKGSGLPSWLIESERDAANLESSLQTQLEVVNQTQGHNDNWASLASAKDTIAGIREALSLQAERISSGQISGDVQPGNAHFGSQALQNALGSLLGNSAPQAGDLKSFLAQQDLEDTDLLTRLQIALSSLPERASTGSSILEPLTNTINGIPTFFAQESNGLLATLAQLQAEANSHVSMEGISGHSWSQLVPLALLVTGLVLWSAPKGVEDPLLEPLPQLSYNNLDAAAYWAQRPIAVARRSAVVLLEAAQWGLGFAVDKLTGRVRQNASKRAVALRGVLERLGPAYVKIAQAVSTRVDLLEPEYLIEIERLQDKVPPFPNPVAEAIMQKSLGRRSDTIFASLSTEPVAAASLGQVYRGRLRQEFGGHEVAVKVQRPGVLKAVALDLYLMRRLAVILDRFFGTHWMGIIDEWSVRFYHEMDYSREAKNAMRFKEEMRELDGITVPHVYREFCTQEVLTTAWVKGVKLSESNASDVRELCTTLLNCYLIQLLETGNLHADPHPGNLLRTPDGKICILDYGLMTQISPERSIALVEYIAHLTSEDYASIPGDLYKLGFIPDGAQRPEESGLVEPLSRILRQLSQGGGAKAINIDEVYGEMEELTRKYPFQIPSYFALILRAFSVIEGIALRVDPNYAIVQECFPYVSRRLFTDNSPRVRGALQQMLYGKRKRLDIGRLRRLANGFGDFTVGGLSQQPTAVQGVRTDQPLLNDTAVEALRTLFREEGSFIQEVAVAESVAAVDAAGREASSRLVQAVLGSVPVMASLSFIQGLGPLRLIVLPLPTPAELLNSFAPRLEPTSEDQEALFVARTIGEMLQQNGQMNGNQQNRNGLVVGFQLARELQPILPELLPGILATAQLFVRSLVQRVAIRVAEEAGRRPDAYANLGSPSSNDAWSEQLITSSPLWLIMPDGLLQWPHTTLNRNQPLDE